MNPVGLGFDLVDLERFRLLYGDSDPDTLCRVFTPHELEVTAAGADRWHRLAARWAVKEAVLKVLGGMQDGMSWTDIELRTAPDGSPSVKLHRGASAKAQSLGITSWLVSISHTDNTVGAVTIGAST
ncbi:holo-ACP synthase [Devosia sediminis]|uniref:Holo-[acyl-carrier-protein] synthase n=1 Tax=Devosia sediminis TaxID=2798801 RepID=A0A934MME5_9HYPH|nr:holo-ACP synthase [Devosia sediminis]MBJ3785626.1 holo-ACP synthase [Devosia sediminis]